MVLWSEGHDQSSVFPDFRDRILNIFRPPRPKWIFSDGREQNLVFPNFADRGNVSATGASQGKLTTVTEGTLVAPVEKLVAAVKKLVAMVENLVAAVEELVAAWSKN